MSRSSTSPVLIAAALGVTFAAACSAPGAATPEQRLADRLRNTTWEGAEGNVAALGTLDYRPGHAGERVDFRGDSTVVFSRSGATIEATYTIADSSHLRVRPVGSAAGQTVLVNLTNGDTLRMLPSPFPTHRAAYGPVARGGAAGSTYGEWLRRSGR